MAKGQSTDSELSMGLHAVGNLKTLSAVSGLRRDSPFAPTPIEPPPAVENPEPIANPEVIESRPRTPKRSPGALASGPRPERRTQEKPTRDTAHTDAVTVPMTAEMRSRASLLAAELQRRRTDRTARITANSIFRVAIQVFLDRYEISSHPGVNTEEELLELARKIGKFG